MRDQIVKITDIVTIDGGPLINRKILARAANDGWNYCFEIKEHVGKVLTESKETRLIFDHLWLLKFRKSLKPSKRCVGNDFKII